MSGSVDVFGVRPGREPGHDVEFSEERTDDLGCVVLRGELLELFDDLDERCLDSSNGVFRVLRPLLLETAAVPEELLSIELGDRVLRANRPRSGNEAGHAGSSD